MSSINQEPLHGYKLLLVEDDKSIVEGLEYYLSQEGFQVTCCYDMASTMEILEKNTFDIAILDLSLPDGSGYDICLKIKNTNDIPIIFLTARR